MNPVFRITGSRTKDYVVIGYQGFKIRNPEKAFPDTQPGAGDRLELDAPVLRMVSFGSLQVQLRSTRRSKTWNHTFRAQRVCYRTCIGKICRILGKKLQGPGGLPGRAYASRQFRRAMIVGGS